MSSHALVRPADPLVALRWLDLVVLAAAAPFVLLAGLPALGFLVGAAAWLAARIGGDALDKRGRASGDLRRQAFTTMAIALGRAWFVGLSVLAVGLIGNRDDGLTAAITVVVVFTVYLATTVLLRPLQRRPQ